MTEAVRSGGRPAAPSICRRSGLSGRAMLENRSQESQVADPSSPGGEMMENIWSWETSSKFVSLNILRFDDKCSERAISLQFFGS